MHLGSCNKAMKSTPFSRLGVGTEGIRRDWDLNPDIRGNRISNPAQYQVVPSRHKINNLLRWLKNYNIYKLYYKKKKRKKGLF